MKKLTYLFTAALCMLVASLCACSSGNDDMYQLVGADNAVILSFSPEQIIRNAGFTMGSDGLQAPEGLSRLTGGDKTIETLLKIKGIDPANVVVTADIADNDLDDAIMAAHVTDKGDVTKFLEEQHYTKASTADGYDIYEIQGSALMLGDDILVILEKTSAADAPARLAAIRDKAAKSPIKDWQKDVLDGDETLKLITNTARMQMAGARAAGLGEIVTRMNEKLYGDKASELRSVVTATLKGNTLEGESNVCDADGKKMKIKVDCPKIDTSLLKYCHSGDQCIIMTSAASLIDWNELLSTVMGRAQAAIAGNILSDIDGTVMISGAVTDANDVARGSGFQLTVAAQFKDAKKYASQIESLVGGQTSSYGDVRTVQLPGMPAIAYTVKDKTLVISVGQPITDEGAGVFKGTDFSGKINVFDLRLPAGNAAVTGVPLPFSPVFTIEGDTSDSEFRLKLDGSDKPLLEQLISFASQF